MADYAIHDTTLTGISNVIRKKDGTSALIDPADYADRINLMGMLEEKTISSSPIVTFSDGADAVPLKKCEVSLSASLDGYSEVDVHHTGSNVWDEVTELGAINVTNGQNVANNNFIRSTNYIPVLPNTTYYKCAPQNYLQLYYDKDKGYLSYGSWNKNTTFTTPPDCYFVRFYVAQEYGTTYNNDISLNYPATFTEYAPYSGTTHTADLGRTIYGGSGDVVNGQGESKCGKIVFDGSSDENWTAYAGGNGYLIAVADMERGTWYTSEFAESSPLTKVPDNNSLGVRIGVNNNGIYVVQANTIEGVTDLASFKAYLAENPLTVVYPLATPEDFTFDPVPIDSKLGNNTIWSEQGDTEVTYRSQGTVYQYPEGEGVSF